MAVAHTLKVAEASAGVFHAPPPNNGVWELPSRATEIHHKITASGPWMIVTKIRSLAVTLAGDIYGMRTMTRCRECGYDQEGRVKVGGKWVRAFTSSKLFRRPDGSLVDVAVLVVCWPEKK